MALSGAVALRGSANRNLVHKAAELVNTQALRIQVPGSCYSPSSAQKFQKSATEQSHTTEGASTGSVPERVAALSGSLSKLLSGKVRPIVANTPVRFVARADPDSDDEGKGHGDAGASGGGDGRQGGQGGQSRYGGEVEMESMGEQERRPACKVWLRGWADGRLSCHACTQAGADTRSTDFPPPHTALLTPALSTSSAAT